VGISFKNMFYIVSALSFVAGIFFLRQ